MPKKKSEFVVQMVRPDVPEIIDKLAAMLTKEKGVPVTKTDAASIAVRETYEARKKARGSLWPFTSP